MTSTLISIQPADLNIYKRHLTRGLLAYSKECALYCIVGPFAIQIGCRLLGDYQSVIVPFVEDMMKQQTILKDVQVLKVIVQKKNATPRVFGIAVVETIFGGDATMQVMKSALSYFFFARLKEMVLKEGMMFLLCQGLNVLSTETSGGKSLLSLQAPFLEGSYHQLYNFHLTSKLHWMTRWLPTFLSRSFISYNGIIADDAPAKDVIQQHAECTPRDLAMWQVLVIVPPAFRTLYHLIRYMQRGAKVSPTGSVVQTAMPHSSFFVNQPWLISRRTTPIKAILFEVLSSVWSVGSTYVAAQLGQRWSAGMLHSMMTTLLNEQRGPAYIWSAYSSCVSGSSV